MNVRLCQQELLEAIKQYQNLFTSKKPMPEHRVNDVKHLLKIINKEYLDFEIRILLNDIRAYLLTMRTGIWLCMFNPGHSRLKNKMNKVINKYQVPYVIHSSDSDSELNHAFYRLRDTSSESEEDNPIKKNKYYVNDFHISINADNKRKSCGW